MRQLVFPLQFKGKWSRWPGRYRAKLAATDQSWRRAFEQGFAPLARRLGWRPEFRWQRLAQWAAGHAGVRLIERRPMPPLGHFSLIRFARVAQA